MGIKGLIKPETVFSLTREELFQFPLMGIKGLIDDLGVHYPSTI